MALAGFSNLAGATNNLGVGSANMGFQVTNNPGFSVSAANPYTYSENFGGLTPDVRKTYYQAGDYSQLPSIMDQTGLTLGAITTDFNQLMGQNLNPVDVAMMIYGIDANQVVNFLQSGDPGAIAQVANQLGIDATSLTNWYNQQTGNTFTPEQTTAYLTQGPSTTSNLMDMIAGARGPSSSSSSSNQSSSFSGMDWSKSPVSFAQLQQLSADLPNLANQYSATSYNRYAKMLRDALGDKGNFAGVFNSMGARNMSGSSVASDALGNAMLGITKDIGDKAYASDIAGLNAQMQVPKTLADIANLGQISQSQSSGGSGSSTSSGNLANFSLIADMLGGSMFA